MTATTGTLAVRLNIWSSLNMMSDAVTVPPGLLMRTMTRLDVRVLGGLLQLLAKAHEQTDARRRARR